MENGLHWVLDVTFREDDSRVRDRTAARNLALLRKIALDLVAKDRGSRASLRGRRKKAAWYACNYPHLFASDQCLGGFPREVGPSVLSP